MTTGNFATLITNLSGRVKSFRSGVLRSQLLSDMLSTLQDVAYWEHMMTTLDMLLSVRFSGLANLLLNYLMSPKLILLLNRSMIMKLAGRGGRCST